MQALIKEKKLSKKGFTLIELMLVLAILAILVAVLVPKYSAYTNSVKSEVCHINCEQLEKRYEIFLITDDATQPEILFGEYLKEYGEDVCPDGGEIAYWDGRVKCGIHSLIDDSDGDSGGGDVPFL